jgi:hypothetical protein
VPGSNLALADGSLAAASYGPSGHSGRLIPDQARAASLTGAILVLANAGTGKTGTLTASVALRIVHRGIPQDRILAVTFTNKAARDPSANPAEVLAGRTRHGWFVYANECPAPPIPDDMALMMRHARHLGCEYILLDCDAFPLEDLTVLHP